MGKAVVAATEVVLELARALERDNRLDLVAKGEHRRDQAEKAQRRLDQGKVVKADLRRDQVEKVKDYHRHRLVARVKANLLHPAAREKARDLLSRRSARTVRAKTQKARVPGRAKQMPRKRTMVLRRDPASCRWASSFSGRTPNPTTRSRGLSGTCKSRVS